LPSFNSSTMLAKEERHCSAPSWQPWSADHQTSTPEHRKSLVGSSANSPLTVPPAVDRSGDNSGPSPGSPNQVAVCLGRCGAWPIWLTRWRISRWPAGTERCHGGAVGSEGRWFRGG
jgi:hypothetical protein